MSFFELKNPLKSLTIWGSLLSLVSILESLHEGLQALPLDFLPEKERALATAAIGLLGVILSVLGRFKASKKIGF